MQSATQISSISKEMLSTGRVFSGLAVLFLLFDSIFKLLKPTPASVVDAFNKVGYPPTLAMNIGLLLLACVVVYVIPRTAVLGAILLTGYLGGAVATHLRVGDPLFSHVLFLCIGSVYLGRALLSRGPRASAHSSTPLSERNNAMQKITPFLWFDNNAEEAVNFYLSIFKNSRIVNMSRWGDAGPVPKGTVMSVTFELNGQEFMALNGGPTFKFSPAISFFVKCETQQEVDDYWEKLSVGGTKERCGWLKDKFGVSWQIIPDALSKFLQEKDVAKSKRVMNAMLQMQKIDIQGLQRAYEEA